MLNKKLRSVRLKHFMNRLFAGKGYEAQEGPSNQTSALSSEYGDDLLWKDVSRRLPASFPVSLHTKVRRARCVLRVFVLLRLIYRDLLLYGTSSGLIDHSDRYKPHLVHLLRHKEISLYQPPPPVTNWCSPFHPKSAGRRLWEAVMLILLVATIVFVPVEIAFYEGEMGLSVDITMTVIDSLFLLNVLVTLNTSFFHNKTLVQNRKKIAINYLKGTLIIDVLSSIPLDLFSFGIRSKALLRYLRVFRLIKVFRAARFHRVIGRLLKAEEESAQRVVTAVSRVLGACVVMMLLTHLMACLWYLSALYGEKAVNWVTVFRMEDRSVGEKYLISLYWSITVLSTVGFGDIYATTPIEIVLSCAWMLIGAMFFSFFLSTMSSVITGLDLKGHFIREKLSLLLVYCKDLQLSKSFQSEMTGQLHVSLKKSTLDQWQKLDLAMNLRKGLRVEMGRWIYRQAALKVRFFAQQNAMFLGNIVPMLEYRLFQPSETIYTRGSHSDEIYFLGDGRVCFVLGSLQIPFRTVISGSFFGEIEVLESRPREYTAISLTSSETFILPLTILSILKDDFPLIISQLTSIAKRRKSIYLRSLIQTSHIVGQLEYTPGCKIGVDKVLLNGQYMKEIGKLEEEARRREVEGKGFREELRDLAGEVVALKSVLMKTGEVWRRILQYG